MESELWRLAWNETELRDAKKIFSGLVFGVLTIVFNWVAGLRTWQQALLFIVCSIAAYLFLTLLEVIFRYYKHWRIRRKCILISTVDDLSSRRLELGRSLATAQGKFVEFKDVCEEVERSWRDLQKDKTDSQRKWFNKTFPDAVITAKDIEPFCQQLITAAANLAEEIKSIQELLKFRLGPLI